MYKFFFKTAIGWFLLLPFIHSAYADLNANISRAQYAPRDTIVLKIETTNPGSSVLDTSPLIEDFLLLDQKEMTINSYADGRRNSVIRWELQLRARKSGQIVIPSLTYNNEFSNPLNIFVKSSNVTRFLPVSDEPIILDANINHDDNYEGALFLYTLNLYSDRPLEEGYQITAPKLLGGTVKLLEQSDTKKVEIRGREYDVLEQYYAIYPKEMGRFIIEGPVFEGAQIDSNVTQVRSNNLEINVKARQDFENAKYWLPASRVTIEEKWQKNDPMLVGDTIIREVTLSAQGIAASDLPEIITNNPEIINVLDTKVSLTDQVNKQGIKGTRIEQQTIQLLERGEITFPRIEIFWWDTNTDSQKSSVIEKNILSVLPGINGESSIEREKAQNINNNQANQNITVIKTESSWLLWILVGLLIISAMGWIYHLRKVKRSKEQEQEGFGVDNEEDDPDTNDLPDGTTAVHSSMEEDDALQSIIDSNEFNAKAELTAFQSLGRTCLQNDITNAHRCLINWANLFWFDEKSHYISDIARTANDPSLNLLLAEMQNFLDENNTNEWQGKQLFSLLTEIRAK